MGDLLQTDIAKMKLRFQIKEADVLYFKNSKEKAQRKMGKGLVIGLIAPVISGYMIYRHVIRKHK